MSCQFFFSLFQYFKGHLCGEAACFRLKVRGERLKARGFYRIRSKLFLCCRPKARGAIVDLVALAVLVALGAAEPRGSSRGRNRES